MPMKASAKHGNRSLATSPSTTQSDLTPLLTAAPRIKPTSIRCRSAQQLNPGADDPLSDAEILFKGPGPPQLRAFYHQPSAAKASPRGPTFLYRCTKPYSGLSAFASASL